MRGSCGHPPGVVLSGATGFLGGEVLARLLVDRDEPVYVLIRASDDGTARRRLRETLTGLRSPSRRI